MSPSPDTAVPTVEELEAQERRLVFRRFTHDDAWALGSLLVELARERQAPVAIDIHRAGQQLFHAALPGSTPDNDAWIARKRRVVERYGSASYLVGSRFRAKGTTFEESSRLDPDTYAAHGGSFPPHRGRRRSGRRGDGVRAPAGGGSPPRGGGAGALPGRVGPFRPAGPPDGPLGESAVGTRGWQAGTHDDHGAHRRDRNR